MAQIVEVKMKKWTVISIAAFAFGVGCVAAPHVVPPVRANSNAPAWEHLCEHDMSLDDINDFSNRRGAEGWEMVAGGGVGSSYFVCFKRPR